MSGVLLQSRDAAPRQDSAKSQGVPWVVPSTADPGRRRDRLARTPIGLSQSGAEPARGIAVRPGLSIGGLFYLAFVGLIAAGVVAVFFGTGLLLLEPSGDSSVSGSTALPGSRVASLPPYSGPDELQARRDRAVAPGSEDAVQSSAALPPTAVAPGMAEENAAPPEVSVGGAVVQFAPAPPAAAPGGVTPPTPGLSPAEMTELLEHGDALLRTGDVVSARLFYERAAGAGDGHAALRLGATFDPSFINRLGLRRQQANPADARMWYSRALDLGVMEARRPLNGLETKQGK